MVNIFQYLYNKKGKKIPLKYKLLNNIELTKEDLICNGNLDLTYFNITYLPNNLTVNGSLYVYGSKIKKLPDNLTVNLTLNINSTKISDLPDNLIVKGSLWCRNTPLADEIKKDPSLLEKYSKQVKGDIFYDYYLSILRKN